MERHNILVTMMMTLLHCFPHAVTSLTKLSATFLLLLLQLLLLSTVLLRPTMRLYAITLQIRVKLPAFTTWQSFCCKQIHIVKLLLMSRNSVDFYGLRNLCETITQDTLHSLYYSEYNIKMRILYCEMYICL